MIERGLKFVLAVALLIEIGVVFFNVVGRTFFDFPLLWSDEAAKLSLSTIAFLGGALAYRRKEHASVRALLSRVSPETQAVCAVLTDFLVLTVSIIAGANSHGSALLPSHQQSSN